MPKNAKKTLSFKVLKEYFKVQTIDELLDQGVSGMTLIEEKDWGMPWPDFDDHRTERYLDGYYNPRKYVLEHYLVEDDTGYDDYITIMLAKEKVQHMLKMRQRYVKSMIKKLLIDDNRRRYKDEYWMTHKTLFALMGELSPGNTQKAELVLGVLLFCFAFMAISKSSKLN